MDTVKLVDLDIDQKDLVKKLAELQGKITNLKDETKKLEKANKELDKEGKKNTQQYKDNAKQVELNKNRTKDLSTAYRNNQNVLVALNSTETRQLGTLQKLELSNKKLRAETKTLDLTRKSGQARLKEVNKQLDQNNKTILKNADATKAQKMNIGNYGSALGGLGGPLGAATRGVQMLNTAFKFLILNPIGLILIGIAGAVKVLGDAMKRNQPAIDTYKATISGIGAAYDILLDRYNVLLRAMIRFDLKGIIEAHRGLFKEIRDGADAAKELTLAMQELYRQETKDVVQIAELKKAIEEKRLASKNANITEQERLVLLKDAMAREEELLDIQVAAAEERERIAIEEGDISVTLDEQQRVIAEATANRINVQTAAFKRMRTLASELKTVETKVAKETMELAEQEMLAAAKALDNEVQLEKIKSVTINEIRDEDVEKQKERADELNTIVRDQGEVDIEIARLVSETKFAVAQNLAGSLAALFGQQTAIGKAAAVAEATINTYRSAVAAYAAVAGILGVGPIWAPLAAAAAITTGLANVKKILAVKSGLPGDTGAGASGISAGSITTPRGTFQTGQVTSDGGISVQTLIDSTANAVEQGVKKAMSEIPRNVLVVEEVTVRQGSQKAVSQVATV